MSAALAAVHGAIDAALAGDWPEPDRTLLDRERRAAPRFPAKVFGSAADWVTAAAAGASSPIDYTAGTLLSVASTLIGNARWVSPWSGWRQCPVIGCGLVGYSGDGKTPGMLPVLEGLKRVEGELAQGHPERRRRWEAEKETARLARDRWLGEVKEAHKLGVAPPPMPENAEEPPEPTPTRLQTQDVTVEAAADLVVRNRKGVLVWRDEIAGLVGGFDRYGGQGRDRAFYLEGYDGGAFTIDRRTSGPIAIDHLTIALLGGVQPDRLNSLLLHGDDDGLAARLILLWPSPVPFERPKVVADPETLMSALRRLQGLTMAEGETDGRPRPKTLLLAADAADRFEEWCRQRRRADKLGGMYGSHLAKLPGLALRLALVLQHLWWAFGPGKAEPADVTLKAVAGALLFIDDYLIPMSARVYGDAALPEEERLARGLARWVARNRPAAINGRELQRQAELPELSTAAAVTQATSVLIDAGWLRPAEGAPGALGGRPRRDWLVNPKLPEGRR